MTSKEIINKINEWLTPDLDSFGDDVKITLEQHNDDEVIKITVWDVHMTSILEYDRERMTDSYLLTIAQMIRSAWIIGRVQFLNGERSGFHQAEKIWRK